VFYEEQAGQKRNLLEPFIKSYKTELKAG
jgi:hypothetical protein